MNLLLKEDVTGLGFCGDEVKVKDGYGRNFLIPQGKAIMATPKNLKQFVHQKSIVQGKMKKAVKAAQDLADQIEKITCTFKKKVGDQGKLFGSVTTREIAETLQQNGVEIDKRKMQLADSIKSLGEFKVPVVLHSQVKAEIKVSVVRDGEAPAEVPPEETELKETEKKETEKKE
ncbi:MAG: 50S ribosomal protein L9 [Nitrospinaceae bacterium]